MRVMLTSISEQHWRTGIAITMHSQAAQKQLQRTWLSNLKLRKKRKKMIFKVQLNKRIASVAAFKTFKCFLEQNS